MHRRSKNVHYDSSDGEDGSLPLSPLLFLPLQSACGLGEEHHVLFALDLALEELERGAVEAHHILKKNGKNRK